MPAVTGRDRARAQAGRGGAGARHPGLVQGGVGPAARHQLVVRSELDQLAAVDHADEVGPLGGRQPVGDHDHGPALEQPVDRRLDQRLGAGVEARGRLVEHEHRRIGERGPGQRHELLLAGRQPAAPLAHLGVEAVGQHGEAVVGADGTQRVVDLGVGGVGPGQPHVVADGAVEQEPLLRDDHDAPPQRRERGVAQVDPAEAHVPLVSGRRGGRRAWPASTCRHRSGPPARAATRRGCAASRRGAPGARRRRRTTRRRCRCRPRREGRRRPGRSSTSTAVSSSSYSFCRPAPADWTRLNSWLSCCTGSNRLDSVSTKKATVPTVSMPSCTHQPPTPRATAVVAPGRPAR